MQHAPIFALAAVLLLSLVLGTVFLVRAGSSRQMRERVRSLARQVEAAPVQRSIRVGAANRSPFALRVLRFFRFDPDIPQEQVIPWPVVLLIGVGVGAGGIWWLSQLLGLVLGVPCGIGVGVQCARMIFGWQHARYCDAVFQQIPDTLGLMVRAIRAGLPLADAVRNITTEMPSPTKEEFSRVVGDMAIGRSVDTALVRLHERTGLTEYAFLAVTLGLQSQTGGSLAETLDNLSEMVRKRVAMVKRAKALAGEAKAQAGLLIILPFIAAAAMSFIQPFYIAAFTQNPTGQRMGLIGLGLMLLGLLTIRWLIRQAGRD
ncbi:tight adherence protein B [Humitalea rosea]|uniref:Tight adherence protein B n=1 Tax=Humitalea rosea TaxID=990373 RepID=A0A2W7IN84_9PROT|nr:type II secretion system F family protein [Humitalea rosea]PZW48413.1 tight adherence protein B [Humitalea rosea]